MTSSNRTKVELKYRYAIDLKHPYATSNRTKVELKFFIPLF